MWWFDPNLTSRPYSSENRTVLKFTQIHATKNVIHKMHCKLKHRYHVNRAKSTWWESTSLLKNLQHQRDDYLPKRRVEKQFFYIWCRVSDVLGMQRVFCSTATSCVLFFGFLIRVPVNKWFKWFSKCYSTKRPHCWRIVNLSRSTTKTQLFASLYQKSILRNQKKTILSIYEFFKVYF